ncbi:hypothetical protein EW145_g8420 [Phellinidium pouzarii]|uniref:Nudix hydrolase domain-containing protein n=1 Tax=Phellinidium pouzarii TaxID=167371 RepID=A0A4S4K673_9AGAM|nr:hypothetical protein EW145_g8420 [Phellinidium pouzarii]
MSSKKRSTPRVVCCAIPISRSTGKVLIVTSRKRPDNWVSGVHGTITKYVTTIPSATATYHFYELDMSSLENDWLERSERRREWVDFAEAVRRVQWKPELAQALMLSTLAPRR